MTPPEVGAEDCTPGPSAVRGPERPSGDLPVELSSFVGREREIAEVKRLLGDARLLTLTGPGGCGKTRLAMAVAFEVVGSFEDGVWWVGLASLSDPTLVAQEVTQVLGVREAPGRPLSEALAQHLEHKRTLLVLDNCEHLIDACAELVDVLLRSCPNLKVLATSREALAVGGEVAWLVPPLSLPDPEHRSAVEELGRYEGIRLFRERARSFASTFELSEENAPAVAQLCRRLDGMPLAIELAAARTRVLSVEQILKRLEDSLRLLASSDRTAPMRQQTLRGTLDWSYDLLSEPERLLFGRLSVFAGGFSLEAAEAVGTGEDIEEEGVLDLLSKLVDKSLVVVEAGSEETLRYRMLEPVRQYGQERLEEKSREADGTRRRHAVFFFALVEEAGPQLKGARQEAWLELLEREHGNLRAALRWSLEGGDAELGLRLAGALERFWWVRGYLNEGRRWLERGLAGTGSSPTPVRAKALNEAGWLALWQDDLERAVALLEESLALFQELGDEPGIATSLTNLGHAVLHQSDRGRLKTLCQEAEALRRGFADRWAIAELLVFLGMAALYEGDHARAVALLEESLASFRELGDAQRVAVGVTYLWMAALEGGDRERALALLEEDLRLSRKLGTRIQLYDDLSGLAVVAALGGQSARAARLWGAAEALREEVGISLLLWEHVRTDYEGKLAAVRTRLGETAFTAAWAEGRAMTPQQAIEYALGEVQEPTVLPAQQPTPPPVSGLVSAEAKAPAELRIFALGAAQVEVGGHTLSPSDFGYAKPKELLFYLLCHPPRSREQIGLALWPEASTSQLRGSFHEALRRLRKALGGAQWIVYENKRYSFNRSLRGYYFFDVETFEEKLAEAQKVKEESPAKAMSHLKEAVELYGGDFLEGYAATEGEWALVRQQELRRSYQDALFALGGVLLEDGSYSEAAEAYRKIIALERYSEAAHRELMRSEARRGERGRALGHYRELVKLLREELGSSPAPQTVALYEGVLRGEEV